MAPLQSQIQRHCFRKESVARGSVWDYVEDYEARLVPMDNASFQKTLGTCKPNSMVTFVGPQDTLVAQLTEAGIEHEVIDWNQRGYNMHAATDPRGAKKAAR